MKYIYGPVGSRRLGFSLGVDVVPYKTCSFDCVYCQLGRTTNKTVERKEYFPKDEVLRDVKATLAVAQIQGSKRPGIPPPATKGLINQAPTKIDYITLSGSGEPTLNSGIGWVVREIKKITKIPVAVLTNGSLFYDEQVREHLLEANLVVPSLDAGCDEILEFVNRPHPSLSIDKIVEGLKKFRQEYKGKIWLEVMMVKGTNDSVKHIELLKSKIKEIAPDKVQLNTVVRPPSEDFAQALSLEELDAARDAIGRNCEVIGGFKGARLESPYSENIEDNILALLRRRPVTLSDMSSSLGVHRNELVKYLNVMERDGRIKKLNYKGLTYYEHK